jgi:predicted dehydrogenase
MAVSAQFGNFFPDRVVKDGIMERAEEPEGLHGQTAQLATRDHPQEKARSENTGNRLHVTSEDAACVSFRYEDGAIGNVMLSEISPGRGNRLELEIVCERGSLWWNEEENNVLHTAIRGEGVSSQIFAFGNGFEDTFVTLMKHFYEGGEYPSFREAAQVAQVCAAIGKSAGNASEWIKV